MATWPLQLDTEVLSGTHKISPVANVISYPVDAGEPIARRRYEGFTTLETFQQILSAEQKDILLDFWKSDCYQGALSFWGAIVDGVNRKWWFDPEAPPIFEEERAEYYRVTFNMRCVR